MAKNPPSSGTPGEGPSETTLHQSGMMDRAAKWPDASTRCKGGSVNSNATREKTAPTPRTIGPREA